MIPLVTKLNCANKQVVAHVSGKFSFLICCYHSLFFENTTLSLSKRTPPSRRTVIGCMTLHRMRLCHREHTIMTSEVALHHCCSEQMPR
jgi:hypothetical protein